MLEEINNIEQYHFQIQDFIIHKKYVLESGNKLVNYLMLNNQDELAIELLKRLAIHDNSKLEKDEFVKLCNIKNTKNSFINANEIVDENLKKSIELHWKHNSHHPEHFDNVEDMNELDIMEMCCDWYARSCQYKTDFLLFVKTRQENRFHFPDKIFEKIWKYCIILNN